MGLTLPHLVVSSTNMTRLLSLELSLDKYSSDIEVPHLSQIYDMGHLAIQTYSDVVNNSEKVVTYKTDSN